jgi:hypothetical protein
MSSYRIVPTEGALSPFDVIVSEPEAVLAVVERSNFKKADVMRDGVYAFSIRLAENGVWSILQRDDA